MKLPAFEISQNGRKFYVTYMSAEELADEKIQVDVWRRNHPDGYQREHLDYRSNSFTRFITDAKGVSPTAILFSVREEDVRFKPVDSSSSFGTLNIPEDSSLWLVDGQHRLFGIRNAVDKGLQNFQVPVVIMAPSQWNDDSVDPVYEEASQFLTINRTQKGVKPDLAERFLGKLLKTESALRLRSLPTEVRRGIEWIPKAKEISDLLNENCPVWKGRVRLPNEPRDGTLVSEKAMTDSVGPILKNEDFKLYNGQELAIMLTNYWVAISETCPKAFATPEDHVLQKTTGLIVLHRIFPTIAIRCPQHKLTPENFKKIFAKLPSMNDAFWHSQGQAGMVGTSRKSQDIVESKLRTETDGLDLGERKKVFEF